MRIVPAAPGHLDTWREIHNRIIPASPLDAAEVAERAVRNRLTVAFESDEPSAVVVGHATVRAPAEPGATATVIVRILPEHRRRGLGAT